MKGNNTQDDSFFIDNTNRVCLDITVKARLQILLRRKGISQNELAYRVGISNGTMSQISNELWTPKSEVMLKIAAELDCDSVVIFGDTDYWKAWRDKMLYPEPEEK